MFVGGLYARFKLTANINLTNMVLFNAEGQIKKYESTDEILLEFIEFRLGWYEKRKQSIILELKTVMEKLDNQTRFILMVIKEELKIRNIPKLEILNALWNHQFSLLPKSKKKGDVSNTEDTSGHEETEESSDVDEGEEEDTNDEGSNVSKDSKEKEKVKPKMSVLTKGYDYLLSMPLWSLTLEKVQKLKKETDEKHAKLKSVEGTSAKSMWNTDLDLFLEALQASEDLEKLEMESGSKIASSKRRQLIQQSSKIASPKGKSPKNGSGGASSKLNVKRKQDENSKKIKTTPPLKKLKPNGKS